MSTTEHHKPELTIDQLDPGGDIRTLADDAGAWDPAGTRRDMLRRAGLAGVGVAAGGTLLGAFMSPFEAAAQSGKLNWVKRRSAGNDVKMGNYALTLEYLEAAFYRQAVAKGGLSDPDVRRFARTVRDHEVAHVKALKEVLGKAAVRAPKVDFGNAVTDQATFLEVSAAIEPVGTAAYAGAGPWIKSLPILKGRALDPLGRGEPRGPGWRRCASTSSARTPRRRRGPSTRPTAASGP